MEMIGYIFLGVGILLILIGSLWIYRREIQSGSGLWEYFVFLITGMSSRTNWAERSMPFYMVLTGLGFVILGALILYNS